MFLKHKKSQKTRPSHFQTKRQEILSWKDKDMLCNLKTTNPCVRKQKSVNVQIIAEPNHLC